MGEPTAKTADSLNGRTADSQGSTVSIPVAGATGVARTAPRNTLLARLRTPRSPRLWFEVLLIGVSYWLYSLVRNAVPEKRTLAMRHADWVWSFEHHLGLAVEHSVNHSVNSVTWLIVGMNYYYATLHFVITIGVLVWLYVYHPGRYGPARMVLFLTTWLALVGFWAFPLAPPRLMTGGGFVDTVEVHHTWGSMSQGSLAHVSNQYAAMPSMHIGWSLWCGITIATLAKPLWAKLVGALYPVFTLTVIISTGNHFWLDAAGGALCLAVGYGVAYAVYGRWVYRLPRVPARPAAGSRVRPDAQPS
ncbi:phosphatase PAP2 family protein [Streptomyces sp. V4-01]|uniref:Phosphatase PAP2 family protein n=1 Tax=Actinacidiphila polyblastidii TaxID=3110430 RepID=A0ABU7PEC7_9ACTN|nr:phosphatase PAP2 family protein [Streptomyces sp. V4-01]